MSLLELLEQMRQPAKPGRPRQYAADVARLGDRVTVPEAAEQLNCCQTRARRVLAEAVAFHEFERLPEINNSRFTVWERTK